MTNQRRTRLQLTLSPAMRLSLEVLAARTGLPISAQATMILRQALDRTINSAEVRRRIGVHNRQRKHAEWVEEVQVEHAIEAGYAALAKQDGCGVRGKAPLLPHGTEQDDEGPAYGLSVEEEAQR